LPNNLHPQWIRKLGRINVAWPTVVRSQFDASYEPVVSGRLMLLSLPNDDSVCAFNLDTGERAWRFFANGPVRFAPAIHNKRAYFVCDDGFLYCLNLNDGSLIWKFSGAPKGHRQLGNERLVSLWAARGGPAVYDGIVYFAAGFWPMFGIFIHAVDAQTGKVVWTNKDCHYLKNIQLDHDFYGDTSLSPQGYIVATEKYLVIPNGRSMPAYLDRKTGKLIHYMQGYRLGNWQVTSDGRVLTIGNHFYPLKKMIAGENDLFFRDLANPGARPMDAHAIGKDALYGLAEGSISSYPITSIVNPKETAVKKPPVFWWKPGYKYAGEFSYTRYSYNKSWRFRASGQSRPRTRDSRNYFYRAATLIKAGDRLYGSEGRTLFAVGLGEGNAKPALAWKKILSETISSLVAANGKLLVVSEKGSIQCFGAEKVTPKVFEATVKPIAPGDGAFKAKVAEILKKSGARIGYCAVLGVGSGRLIEQLLAQSELRLIVIEKDKAKGDALRSRLIDAGLYGPRAQVVVGDPFAFPFPRYFATLVVSEDWKGHAANPPKNFPAYLFRALRPFGGTAFIESAGAYAKCEKAIAGAGLERCETARFKNYCLLTRSGSLSGSADWTHPGGDAGNTLFGRDARVKPPLGVLWYGDSETYGFVGPKSYSLQQNVRPKVSGGRMFDIKAKTITVGGPGGAKKHGLVLHAVDVYTGLLLWQKIIPVETGGVPGTRFVPQGDFVYVASGNRLLALDAASGEILSDWDYKIEANSQSPGKPKKKIQLLKPIPKNAEWSYLAGSHPKSRHWTRTGYKMGGWKKGRAGFGYGDGDDKTVLKDMSNKYSVVYIRRDFKVDNLDRFSQLGLMIEFDDAFIAYINGREVLRVGVSQGRGKKAKGIQQNEIVGNHAFYPLKGLGKVLRLGTNTLAIEGHNVTLDSSDFSLNPYLQVGYEPPTFVPVVKDLYVSGDTIILLYGFTGKPKEVARENTLLVAIDGKTGRKLWSRKADYSYNTGGFAVHVTRSSLAVGPDSVFTCDAATTRSLQRKQRRGEKADKTSTLMALDIRTGKTRWKHVASIEDLRSDYVAYSKEADVLLAYMPKNLRAYDGRTGKLLWQKSIFTPMSPVMVGPKTFYAFRSLKQIHIAGFIYQCDIHQLRTGEVIKKNVFESELFNCNFALGAVNLITNRNANKFANIIDMESGEVYSMLNARSSCNPNYIPAAGLIVAPNRMIHCVCNYPVQTALSLVNMPEVVNWPGMTSPRWK